MKRQRCTPLSKLATQIARSVNIFAVRHPLISLSIMRDAYISMVDKENGGIPLPDIAYHRLSLTLWDIWDFPIDQYSFYNDNVSPEDAANFEVGIINDYEIDGFGIDVLDEHGDVAEYLPVGTVGRYLKELSSIKYRNAEPMRLGCYSLWK